MRIKSSKNSFTIDSGMHYTNENDVMRCKWEMLSISNNRTYNHSAKDRYEKL